MSPGPLRPAITGCAAATDDNSIVGFGDAWEVARITIEPPFTQTCTVNGTPGDDVLSGAPGATVVAALSAAAGRDVLSGGEGGTTCWWAATERTASTVATATTRCSAATVTTILIAGAGADR